MLLDLSRRVLRVVSLLVHVTWLIPWTKGQQTVIESIRLMSRSSVACYLFMTRLDRTGGAA